MVTNRVEAQQIVGCAAMPERTAAELENSNVFLAVKYSCLVILLLAFTVNLPWANSEGVVSTT